jgi:hypothetical protein
MHHREAPARATFSKPWCKKLQLAEKGRGRHKSEKVGLVVVKSRQKSSKVASPKKPKMLSNVII